MKRTLLIVFFASAASALALGAGLYGVRHAHASDVGCGTSGCGPTEALYGPVGQVYYPYSEAAYYAYGQSGYYSQAGYYAYSQAGYYAYGQSGYYSQATYYNYGQAGYYGYSQAGYYSQSSYPVYSYGQSGYYAYAQSGYYSQATYYSYGQSGYYAYGQSGYYSQGSYGGGCGTPSVAASTTPSRVKAGNTSVVHIVASGVTTSCIITGPTGSYTYTPTSCNINVSTTTTAIYKQQAFTITCDGTAKTKAVANLIPTFLVF